MLKVTVAEVQRSVIKQLGIDLQGSIGYGTTVVSFNTDNPFSAFGQPLSGTSLAGQFKSVKAKCRAQLQCGDHRCGGIALVDHSLGMVWAIPGFFVNSSNHAVSFGWPGRHGSEP